MGCPSIYLTGSGQKTTQTGKFIRQGVNHFMDKWLSIQLLRGMAVLGVVAYHFLTIDKHYFDGNLLLPDFFRLGQSGVDLFFVISGFVMVTVTKNHFAHGGEMMRFIWGRLTRIYPTYWFYFFLTVAIFLVKPHWVNSSQGPQGHQVNLITSFLLLPSNHMPLVMVAWSLIHELWFYLVFAVMLMFKERLLLPLLLLWGTILIIVNAFISTADLSAGARIAFHPYSLEFIIGALVAVFINSNRTNILSSRKAFLIIMLAISSGLSLVYAYDVLKEAGLMRVCIMGALYGLLTLFLTVSEKERQISIPKSMQFMGDISYTVYLSHSLVLSAIARIWMIIKPTQNGLHDNLLACLMMLLAVVCYGWIGYRLVEQPILKIAHRFRSCWFESDYRRAPSLKVNT
jgi:peptidoglycan/LPS O-acetylase OafA/YrhL